jgi:hypothetical protein
MHQIRTISLPEICGLYSYEQLAYRSMAETREAEQVRFNYLNVKWIGALQISLLFGWIEELLKCDRKVLIRLPEPSVASRAIQFLVRMNFFEELQRIGVEIEGFSDLPSTEGLAAFRCFSRQSELVSYENALTDQGSWLSLLGGGFDTEIIRDGHLRDILLHELGENAFLHGNGSSVRYTLIELPAKGAPDRGGFLAFFDSSPYIEIVVSDSGPGLVKVLLR